MRIAICDDDFEAAQDLKDKIRQIMEGIETECITNYHSLKKISEEDYDIVFMDIDWEQELNGIELVKQFNKEKRRTKFIFVTSYTEQYVQQVILENGADIGFLIKPAEIEILKRVVEKMQKLIREDEERKLIVNVNGHKTVINPKDILYIESDNHYVYLICHDTSLHVFYTLNALAKRLPKEFLRCHKGFIVNMRYIRRISQNELLLDVEKRVPVGRSYAGDLKKRYEEYLLSKI